MNADYSPTSPAESEQHAEVDLDQNLDIDLDFIREVGMHREPLIPVMQNIAKMREIAMALHSLDYEAGKLAGSALENTHGGR